MNEVKIEMEKAIKYSSKTKKEKVWEPKFKVTTSSEIPPPPFEMPPLIWQVLYSRGLKTSKEIESHIAPKLFNMTPPLALDDMEKSVERLVEAFIKQEKICIYADFDLDGSSGLTLLKTAMKNLGFQNLMHMQPRRLKEGYGFHKNLVQDLAKKGVNVIITVDVGTSDFEAVEEAQNSNIDVIITDHHLPPEKLPPAYALINPNKKDCSSELGHLCGTGVAFYLTLALKSKLKEKSLLKQDFNPKELLDCFVIGTLTDMVPVKNENRALIKHGLTVLEKTKRIGLRELLKSLDLWGRSLTSQDVTMRFAPKINALSRMEEDVLPVDLFLVEEENQAKEFVQTVIASHQKRLSLQKKAEIEALRSLEIDEIKNKERRFVLLCSKNFHKGILGLLATKISQEFFCPAFVGTIDEENNCILGSARELNTNFHFKSYQNKNTENKEIETIEPAESKSEQNILSALQHASPHLTKFGGHAMASGFQLEISKFNALKESLNEHYSKLPPPPPPKIFYDGLGSIKDINPYFMEWHEKLDPFGTQFEIPTFLIPSVEILSVYPLRGGHLKFKLKEKGSYHTIYGLWFSPPKSSNLYLNSNFYENKITNVDILAEPQWNYFNGNKSIQLLIKDLKPT